MWEFDRRKNFKLEVPFRGALRGCELRAAIADARGEVAERLQLQQRRARRKADRALLVLVVGKPLKLGGYADERGKETWLEKAIEKELHIIVDDEDVFLPGRQTSMISVHRKMVSSDAL